MATIWTKRWRFSRPLLETLPLRAGTASTLSRSSALTSSTVSWGSAPQASAQAPETWGVAIDVPP